MNYEAALRGAAFFVESVNALSRNPGLVCVNGRPRSSGLQHEWMIRVLENLQTYALRNNLSALAEHLDQARLLAMTEISNLTEDEDSERKKH